MIRNFLDRQCEKHHVFFETQKEKEAWARKEKLFTSQKKKYSQLFELCYPKPDERWDYIESMVAKAFPSFGYLCLAHILELGIFDTVITTNFDDLIFTACVDNLFKRPIVHSVNDFKSERFKLKERPRIYKIHGDYLVTDLKTTIADMADEDPNMTQRLSAVFEDCDGMVVIGYSGNDDSVMKLLDTFSKKKYLFWCTYGEEEIGKNVEDYLRKKDGRLVSTDGFEKVMNHIRNGLGIENKKSAGTDQTEKEKAA